MFLLCFCLFLFDTVEYVLVHGERRSQGLFFICLLYLKAKVLTCYCNLGAVYLAQNCMFTFKGTKKVWCSHLLSQPQAETCQIS